MNDFEFKIKLFKENNELLSLFVKIFESLNKHVNSVLIGASNLTQLQENISVLEKFNSVNVREILKDI